MVEHERTFFYFKKSKEILTDCFNPFNVTSCCQENVSQSIENEAHDECWNQQPIVNDRNNCNDSSQLKKEVNTISSNDWQRAVDRSNVFRKSVQNPST